MVKILTSRPRPIDTSVAEEQDTKVLCLNSSIAMMVSLIVHVAVLIILAQIVLPMLRYGSRIETVVQIDSEFSSPSSAEIEAPQSSVRSGGVASNQVGERNLAPTAVLTDNHQRSHDLQLPSFSSDLSFADSSSSRISRDELMTKVVVPMRYMPMHRHRGEARISSVAGTSEIAGEISGELQLIAQEGDAIVVWLFDQSLSMQQDIDALAAKLLESLEDIEADKRTVMMHYVAAFGDDVRMLQDSTSKGFATANAIYKLPPDPSGIENTFQAVEWCVDELFNAGKWQRYRNRQKLLVVWTDESGDDYLRLEKTIQKCLESNVRVDVIGPSAVLGAQTGYTSYQHPVDGFVYQLPVHRGPDSAFPQKLNLGYWFRGVPSDYQEHLRGPYQGTSPNWYGGSNLTSLLSGFSPYALTRLTKQTGGRYLLYDRPGDRPPFDLEDIKEYEPDYRSLQEIGNDIQQRPLRQIVLAASAVTWRSQLAGRQDPLMDLNRYRGWETSSQFQSVSLPRVAQNEYAKSLQALEEVEQALSFYIKAASVPDFELDPTVSQAKKFLRKRKSQDETVRTEQARQLQEQEEEIQVSLLEKLYHDEPSPRWKAWCDLNFGRLLAVSVRLREYLIAIEPLLNPKANGLNPATNRVSIQPSSTLRGGAVSRERLQIAEKLLRRCIANNPNTPWEVMAERELRDPFGLEVIQTATPPPPPRTGPIPPQPKPPALPSL